MADKRTFDIEGLDVVEDKDDHGCWTIYDKRNGLRLSAGIRRLDELYEVIELWKAGKIRGVVGSQRSPVDGGSGSS